MRTFRQGRFEFQNEIFYMCEVSRDTSLRQLRVNFLTNALCMEVISACHVSPFSGHSWEERIFYHALVSFRWPSVTKYIRESIRSCAHSILTNANFH